MEFIDELVRVNLEEDATICFGPYDLGYHAYCVMNARRDGNPFETGTGDHDQWDMAWWDADQEFVALMEEINDG